MRGPQGTGGTEALPALDAVFWARVIGSLGAAGHAAVRSSLQLGTLTADITLAGMYDLVQSFTDLRSAALLPAPPHLGPSPMLTLVCCAAGGKNGPNRSPVVHT